MAKSPSLYDTTTTNSDEGKFTDWIGSYGYVRTSGYFMKLLLGEKGLGYLWWEATIGILNRYLIPRCESEGESKWYNNYGFQMYRSILQTSSKNQTQLGFEELAKDVSS